MVQDLSEQVPRVTLNDGVEMPLLGFGTSGVQLEREQFSKGARSPGGGGDLSTTTSELEATRSQPTYLAIMHAIKCGYRFFDTAALYQNERLVGRALNDAMRANLVTRQQLFVCTKVWNSAHKRRSVMAACRDSLARLQLDYVDLYLIHWPCAYADTYEPTPSGQPPPPSPSGAHLSEMPDHWINPRRADGRLAYSQTHFTETWLGMQDVREARLARSIGLSNFNHKMIEQIYSMADFKCAPSVNQIELHPYLSQIGLAEYSRAKNILLNAYSPLGAPGATWLPPNQPKVIEDPLIKQLARKYNRSPAQIILKYHLTRGVAPIPKSSTPSRIEENIRLFDFELLASELEQLLGLNKNLRYCINTAGELIDDHPLYPFHEQF